MRCTAARSGVLRVPQTSAPRLRCPAAPLLRRRRSPCPAPRRGAVAAAGGGELYTPRVSPAAPRPELRAMVGVPPPVPYAAFAAPPSALALLFSWPVFTALLLAALAACAAAVSLFIVAMWPALKATERASLATEAAMRAFEDASRATAQASLETERLMLRTQAELPATLRAVEDAALQFDRLGLEIRDSGRRFGLTNPAASASALAQRNVGADPLQAAAGAGGDGGNGLALDGALLAPLLPGAEAVSAAVGRLVDEAAAAAAATALEVVSGVDAPAGVASAELLDKSLRALREWRQQLDRVVLATRDVAGGVGAAVQETVEDAAQAVQLRRAREQSKKLRGGDEAADAAMRAAQAGALVDADADAALAELEERQQAGARAGPGWLGGLRKGAGALGGVVAGASGKVASATVEGAGVAGGFVVAVSAGLVQRVASALPWVPKPGDGDQLPAVARAAARPQAALPSPAAAAAETAEPAVLAAVQAGEPPAAQAQAPPAPPTETQLREGRERAVADALALAESTAAQARQAAAALGRPGSAARGSKTAVRTAASALSAASAASGALLDALQRARSAGDAVSPAVLAALEELPQPLDFDDDSTDFAEADLGDDDDDDDTAGQGEDSGWP